MENQIQIYHDRTAFWLDRDWKTPRERELERKVNTLKRENQGLKQENTTLKQRCNSFRQEYEVLKKDNITLGYQNETLKGEYKELYSRFHLLLAKYEKLKVFEDIPCCECGKPMSNNWTRDQVLRAFKGWGHSTCINRR